MYNVFKDKMRRNPYEFLFLGTMIFFLLGMVNIAFSWLGLICATLPFFLAKRSGKALWCQKYCPRSSLFTRIISKISLGRPMPKWLLNKRAKRIMVTYFCLNMTMALVSALMVSLSIRPPMSFLKFFMIFKVPFDLPQLVYLNMHPVILHMSYRLYSLMFTSTLIGIVLAILYKPRTWCTVCPIQTLTTLSIQNSKKSCESLI